MSNEEENNVEETEEVEVEVTEVNLTEEEIDEWIQKLEELKDNKEPITLELDSENELNINYEEKGDEDSNDQEDPSEEKEEE